ncbi:Aspartate/glutamate/uridylate kinase [Polychytrium aggregatum]|uniref:Aspartate/glutamate/uridylate kinase n=1 Tax=Polychytrium aggregatum TaxID=110093 RepID=UPI0022FE90AA|nr:Aspartate/glutamate/uridylate kinase [Polychytrium aggregatum]KAI9202295.1 Aspartate/glutamate/uridylate kinase [Polychytrium aggregatum]
MKTSHSSNSLAGTLTGRPIIVQKYGGTSVGSGERLLEVAAIVKNTVVRNRLIVVLSAMSKQVKSEGTTSRLLAALNDALQEDTKQKRFLGYMAAIERDHIIAIRKAIRSPQLGDEAERLILTECSRIREFLSAAQVIGELAPKSRDVVISTGEKLSAILFTYTLRDQGVDAFYVNLENIIEANRFDAKAIDQSFYDYIAVRLQERLGDFGDRVPVLTGFFGPIPGSMLETIGRGYTDLAAALAAVGTSACELQIWKEVDGIFTADPRKVPKAKLLERITPEEAAELSYYGSEVIHPFTMDQVIDKRIPIRILNTFNPSGRGTLIEPREEENDRDDESDMSRSVSIIKEESPEEFWTQLPDRPTYPPTAITMKEGIIVVSVRSNRKNVSHEFMSQVFAVLNKHGIVSDLVSTSEINVSIAIYFGSQSQDDDALMVKLGPAVQELGKLGSVAIVPDRAIISLVGKAMKHTVGISGMVFSILGRNHINVEMISQGYPETNISVVVKCSKAAKALQVIHDHCILLDGHPSKYSNPSLPSFSPAPF